MLWSQLSLCRKLTVPAPAPCPAVLAAEAIGVAETLETDKFPMEKLQRITSGEPTLWGKAEDHHQGMSSNR